MEVLRGPQGTLYCRNATGGAVNVLSRDPSRDPSGYLDVTIGNYGLVQTEGALSGPLGDTLSARFAFQTVNRCGWGKSIITGSEIDDANTVSLRGKLRWSPRDGIRIDVQGHYHREDDANYALHYFGRGPPDTPLATDTLGYLTLNFSRDVSFDTDVSNKRKTYSADVKGRFDLSDHLSLVALGSYEKSAFDTVNDGDGTALLGVRTEQADNSRTYSADVQIVGKYSHRLLPNQLSDRVSAVDGGDQALAVRATSKIGPQSDSEDDHRRGHAKLGSDPNARTSGIQRQKGQPSLPACVSEYKRAEFPVPN